MPNDIISANTERLNQWFDERFAIRMEGWRKNQTPMLALLVSRGTLDGAYPPFIIAATAKALGWDVTMFCTFYGLGLLKKRLNLKISALGNPAMPMKIPFGPTWLREIEWNMPNLVMAAVPGFENLATMLMRETLRQKGVAPIEDLRAMCLEMEINLMACQMTVDLFGWKKEDFIPEISEWAGAATFLGVARDSDVCLFM